MSYPDFWPETRRDLCGAFACIEHNELMTVDEWCAWMWHLTGIMTAPRFYHGSQFTIGLPEGHVHYFFVSQICRDSGPWVRSLGAKKVEDMLGWLGDLRERQNGWNRLCSVQNGENAPNMPMLRQQLKSVAEQKSMFDAPRQAEAEKGDLQQGGQGEAEAGVSLAIVGHIDAVSHFMGDEDE
jgi:hypothetical protein